MIIREIITPESKKRGGRGREVNKEVWVGKKKGSNLLRKSRIAG